ncbi:penicillin-binding protein [Treponema saccharophilum]|uniref:Peptidoglycan glycosyltransferase n=1 Tax=Treponema saccharophilum DSM 2985 TaxID=907348 RepID=H7EK60_9SPIR|nr:penicillin-binding protein [Treponema saccharophilum]EIC01947.1 Peptidoglycan glycosyltransferase [Treponema saccharophilum DSM 2985]BDC96551.1 penicillin-binding protein [Treponema saccharophilum]
MQVNGYIKKWPMVAIIALTTLFSLVIIVKFGVYSFSGSSSSQGSVIASSPQQNQQAPQKVPSGDNIHRGSIFDRNGKALAVATNYYHFGVTPSAIRNPQIFAKIVSPILGETEKSILKILSENAKASFVYIKKKIDQTTYEDLRRMCEKNGYTTAVVRYDKIPGRVYPENDLASQLIGFMGAEGRGLAGIEYSMQDTLSPMTGIRGEEIQGKNIYLTIDANLQSQLEKIAMDAMESTQAESMMLVAADAKNGEILSYISYPSVNLNEYTSATKEQMMDRPAAESYEPGSVFKIFSVASFLDEGVIKPDEVFVCDGTYEKKTNSGERIRITCLGQHGSVTAREALKYSCNDALAQMSEKIESEIFLKKLRSFGFGAKTGVELPGETAGSLKNTSDRYWSARSKPTIAIGQEIGVSALQMVQAATVLANGGVPVQLSFISKIVNSRGEEEFVHEPVRKNRVIRESTAKYLLNCMETVAQSGTGIRSQIDDVSIGVKTGTAQMADIKTGGYSDTDFLSNCIAVFPVENPEIILYIVIEKAKGETYAGRIVAPVIKKAANVIIDQLGMSRKGASSLAHSGVISISRDPPVVIKDKLPNFKGMSKRQILPLFEQKNLHIKITGNGGWVVDQKPPAGTKVTNDMEIELVFE